MSTHTTGMWLRIDILTIQLGTCLLTAIHYTCLQHWSYSSMNIHLDSSQYIFGIKLHLWCKVLGTIYQMPVNIHLPLPELHVYKGRICLDFIDLWYFPYHFSIELSIIQLNTLTSLRKRLFSPHTQNYEQSYLTSYIQNCFFASFLLSSGECITFV